MFIWFASNRLRRCWLVMKINCVNANETATLALTIAYFQHVNCVSEGLETNKKSIQEKTSQTLIDDLKLNSFKARFEIRFNILL